MNRRYTNKVAVVTGAAGGIGLATAQRLGQEGASVVLVDLDRDALQAASERVLQAGAPAAWKQVCNVAMEAEVEAAVAATAQRHGRLDLVVNNAGLMAFKALEAWTADDWHSILGVDLMGAFFFTKHAFLHMRPGSAIVNVASIHALQTTALVAPYAAAKAAMLSLTRSTALEGRPKGIRCNAVLPGAVETKMLRDNPQVQAGIEHIDPAELGHPSDIAAAVAYLGSDDAQFVQGTTLIVDGGRLAAL